MVNGCLDEYSLAFLSGRIIKNIQATLENNNAGFRKLPGTTLKNEATGKVVYTPPQKEKEIIELMTNLEKYINDDKKADMDPLIKMAVIHFQFESIHPFYDGNGRTGRIINILFLIMHNLLNLPILYLSRYIIRNKKQYYTLLQTVRDEQSWEEWLIYMIEGIRETSLETITLIKGIKKLMQECKINLRDNYKFYSQDLLNNLFKHPYTKIEFVQEDLGVSRITASGYLNQLAKNGVLVKHKIWNANYYVNEPLMKLLERNL